MITPLCFWFYSSLWVLLNLVLFAFVHLGFTEGFGHRRHRWMIVRVVTCIIGPYSMLSSAIWGLGLSFFSCG